MNRTCRTEKYLTAYADGELSPRLRKRVERHVGSCETCARELDSIRSFARILCGVPVAPPVPAEKWERFERLLSQELDRIDRKATRPARIPEARPVFGDLRKRGVTLASVGIAAAIALLVFWPTGIVPIGVSDGNACIVESIETHVSGYTPMAFTSDDPEMTVIWVFSEEVERSGQGNGPGSL
ncbi:zf-HC2 domain-containing protein [bacterium]|nr:zf-HC2 domain-containing protein [bacterium]